MTQSAMVKEPGELSFGDAAWSAGGVVFGLIGCAIVVTQVRKAGGLKATPRPTKRMAFVFAVLTVAFTVDCIATVWHAGQSAH